MIRAHILPMFLRNIAIKGELQRIAKVVETVGNKGKAAISGGFQSVEMRGIEPRSDSNATGLLRVQFAKEFLGLSVSRKLGRLEQAQSTKSPLIPIDKELKQWLSK